MIFCKHQDKTLHQFYTIDVEIEFSLNHCSLGSSELLDEMPDVVYNNIEDVLKKSVPKLYPSIHQHMELNDIDIFYDFSYVKGFADCLFTEYAYSAEVTMILNISDPKLLNYYKIKCPDEINRRYSIYHDR